MPVVRGRRAGIVAKRREETMKIFHPSAGALIMMLWLFLSAMRTPVLAQLEQCSPTEAWLPVGLGLPGNAMRAEILNDKLYVLATTTSSPSFPFDSVGLFTWNGTMWILVSDFRVVYYEVFDMQAYDGYLYISGNFQSVNGIPGTDGLARWDGTAWSAVPGKPVDGAISAGYNNSDYPLAVYDGDLYSMIYSSPPNNRPSLAIWNGNSWRIVEIPSDYSGMTSFAELNGALYIGGFFDRTGGADAHGVARWDGTGWTTVKQKGLEEVNGVWSIFAYQNQLYAFIYDYDMIAPPVMRLDGDEWHPLPELFPRSTYYDMTFRRGPMAVHDGKLYMEGYSEVLNAGIIMRWDGTNAEPVIQLNHWGYFFIDYKGELYTGGGFTSGCNQPLPYVARLCTECTPVSGRVMVKQFPDCADDSLAVGDPGRIVRITPGPRYVVTDDNGAYSTVAGPGTHRLRLLPTKRYWEQICPQDDAERQVTVIDPSVQVSGMDFTVWPIYNRRDLAVSIAGTRVRPMSTTRYTLRCSNPGTVIIHGSLLFFSYDEHSLRPEKIVPEPSRRTPGIIGWDLADLSPSASMDFTIDCMVLPAVREGDLVCTGAIVTNPGDLFPRDNRDSSCVAAVNSYDPNDLAVFPAGTGESGLLSSRDTTLTYTVRFQNTGSDTAYRVVVVDTLSPELDLTSLRLGVSSHPFKLKVINGGALMFIFDDIDLPHQRADDLGSQGYFKFSITLRNGIPPQTKIRNRADIYFDYNEAIKTNTVLSTIAEPVAAVPDESPAAVKIFPNPARGVLYVRGTTLTGSTLVIRDLAGRDIRSLRHDGAGDAELDLAGLPSGTYQIDVETAAGRETHRFVVAR